MSSATYKLSLRPCLVFFALVGPVSLLKFSSFCSSVPAQAGVLALLTLVFWATALIPEHLTALLCQQRFRSSSDGFTVIHDENLQAFEPLVEAGGITD